MRLFCDCKTDEEKSNFFLSGRAVETGVIAPAISNEAAMACHRCAQFKKENDELRARIEATEKQKPVGEIQRANSTGNYICSEVWVPLPVGSKLYALPGAQPAQKAVAYLDLGVGGYMDIGTDLNDEQLASLPKGRHMLGIVGTYGVDGYVSAQPAPSVPEGWKPIPEKHPTFDLVDLKLADGSVLCGCVPQSDGDYWWEGPSGEVFIDPKYAPATHWRLAAAPEAKP